MGSMFRSVMALRQVSQRAFTTTTRKSLLNKVPEKQKLFQENNGVPVYIKGGSVDQLLYRLTVLIGTTGSIYALYLIGKASFPQKK